MIKIVTKDNCPYCDMVKTLISSLWFEYEEIDISSDLEKLREIVEITWMMTVPQIFRDELSKELLLWGYSDIEKLNTEWKLLELLK